jgi:hypothetical protein
MLTKFGNLVEALKFAYPTEEWSEKKTSFKGKKSAQRFVWWREGEEANKEEGRTLMEKRGNGEREAGGGARGGRACVTERPRLPQLYFPFPLPSPLLPFPSFLSAPSFSP